MPQKRKLQIFVSSTYTDLKIERQAAVEAILTGGHIPAGMELFTAGNEAQMNVIQRWIDESDVYLLILGGRYGSIEATSGKSYTHLEYEYSVSKNKPLFALVVTKDHLNAKVRELGADAIETDNAPKLAEFRALVTSKMVRFWSDPRDIKIGILEKLSEFNADESLKGWVPGGDAVDSGALMEELTRLSRENAGLRERNATLQRGAQSASSSAKFDIDVTLFKGNSYWAERKMSARQGKEIIGTVQREGLWCEVVVTNKGVLSATIQVEVSGLWIFDKDALEIYSYFPDNGPHVTVTGEIWSDASQDEEGDWAKITGRDKGIWPGQSRRYRVPVDPNLLNETMHPGSVTVNVYPQAGEHAQKIVMAEELVEQYKRANDL